jgi:hypothetical protein
MPAMIRSSQMADHKPMQIPEDVAASYNEVGQAERFEAGVKKVFSLSPQRAGEIRKEADSLRNPKGRPPKAGPSASRVPVAPLQA